MRSTLLTNINEEGTSAVLTTQDLRLSFESGIKKCIAGEAHYCGPGRLLPV